MAGQGNKLVIVDILVGCDCCLLDSANELALREKAFQNAIDIVF
jgi:hypothetical protein